MPTAWRRKALHAAEYLGFRLGLTLVDRLPLGACEALACKAADVVYLLDRRRRRVARGNLLRTRIASTALEANDIAHRSFRHFGLLAVESLRFEPGESGSEARAGIRYEIPDATMQLLRTPGQGVIVASGHLGNWEIAARLLSEIKPVTGITRPMKNPWTNALIEQRKQTPSFQLTPKHDAHVMRLAGALREGRVLALLVDQHAWDRPMMVNFFGIPAATHTSAALLHLVTRAPLCFGWCTRTGPMAFTLHTTEPLRFRPTGNREADVRAILEWMNGHLESAIRTHPEQYLWAHQRWRVPSRPVVSAG
jgi:Kdo2-lipid IVA lauroyltransferase/acyltransferase